MTNIYLRYLILWPLVSESNRNSLFLWHNIEQGSEFTFLVPLPWLAKGLSVLLAIDLIFLSPPAPKIICWNPSPHGDGIRRWGLWRQWGHEGTALRNGISALIKEAQESSFSPFVMWGYTEKVATYEEAGPPDTECAGSVVLEFPASRALRNPFLLFISYQSVVFCYSWPNRLTHLYECFLNIGGFIKATKVSAQLLPKEDPIAADALAPRNLGACLCNTKELSPRYTHDILYDNSLGIVGLQRTETHSNRHHGSGVYFKDVIDISPPPPWWALWLLEASEIISVSFRPHSLSFLLCVCFILFSLQ